MPIMASTPPRGDYDDKVVDKEVASQSTWDASPQTREGFYTMHVRVPEAKTWIKVDVPKAEPQPRAAGASGAGFSATAAAKKRECARRVEVFTIKEELSDRLSMFESSAAIHVWKCSAETARGAALKDDDDVYYLTWLIAYTEYASDLPGDSGDDDAWRLVDHRIQWSYEVPKDDANLLKVLIFIEPTNQWQDVYVADMGGITRGRTHTTAEDLKHIVASGFDEIIAGKLSLKVTADMIEVRLREASYAKGEEFTNDRAIYNGKWYYVTCNELMKQLGDLDAAAKQMEEFEDSTQ